MMMQLKIVQFLIIIGCCFQSITSYSQTKRILYVDAEKGSDLNDGLTQASALKSLIHTSKLIKAGDHIIVSPGVYRGSIQINAKGTPDAPIIIEGDAIEGSTIITLADSDIRDKKISWTLEDKRKGLYSIPCKNGAPARVLYSGYDLYPYRSKETLDAFTVLGNPGPKHGHYYDAKEKKIYVRLYKGGRYGSTNPNKHLMAVAPPTGTRFDGTLISQPYHYGIGVIGAGDAHIIIDGFTFETPGVAGVYTEGNYVNVKNSWFQGCRAGVSGNYKDRLTTDPEGEDFYSLRFDPTTLDLSASNIIVENCDFHQKPTFNDVLDMMENVAPNTKSANGKNIYHPFWHRKHLNHGLPTQHHSYEIGIANRIGSDWIVRHNGIHDAFEGLSCHALSASRGLRVEYNLFERLLDNAIESEDHASNMHIYRNVIVDVFMPFSFQPLRGAPWPNNIYFTENIIYNTPKYQNLWEDIGFEGRGLFKIGVTAKTWKRIPHMVGTLYAPVTIPGDGLVLANNTILFPGGNLIEVIGGRDMPVHNVNIMNNIIDTGYLLDLNPKRDLKKEHFNFENNTVYFSRLNEDGPANIAAGSKGVIAKVPNAQGLDLNFKPVLEGNSNTRAISVPSLKRNYTNTGAIQPGDNWYPLTVGPIIKIEK